MILYFYSSFAFKQVTILPSANASDTSTRLWHHVGPPSSWHSQWCRCTLGCSSWGQVVHLAGFVLSREPLPSLGKLHQFRRLQYHNIYWCKQKLPYEGCNTAYTQFLVVSYTSKGQKPSWLCSGKPITFSLGLQLIGLYIYICIYIIIYIYPTFSQWWNPVLRVSLTLKKQMGPCKTLPPS